MLRFSFHSAKVIISTFPSLLTYYVVTVAVTISDVTEVMQEVLHIIRKDQNTRYSITELDMRKPLAVSHMRSPSVRA